MSGKYNVSVWYFLTGETILLMILLNLILKIQRMFYVYAWNWTIKLSENLIEISVI